MQDPRRYFEQPADPEAAAASTDMPMEEQGASVLDVLRSINPHKLQSGMTAAAATQVCTDMLLSTH